MADLRVRREVLIFTTPEELRGLADRMEELWSRVRLGDSVEVVAWSTRDQEDTVIFTVDQDRMRR